MTFKVGNIVQLNLRRYPYTEAPNPKTLPQPFGVNTKYRVEEVNGPYIRVSVHTPGPELAFPRFITGGFDKMRFSLAPEPKEAQAMTIERAREQRDRLKAAGVEGLRIRSRSWDNEGLYFAVEADGTSFYKPSDVDKYLETLKPTDLEPFNTVVRAGSATIHQFRVGNSYLPSPYDGSYWWSEADIQRAGGIATFIGKKYRLGRKQFVPFVS